MASSAVPDAAAAMDIYYGFAEHSLTAYAVAVPAASLLTGAVLVGTHQVLIRKEGGEPWPIKALLVFVVLALSLTNAFEIYGHWLQCKSAVRGIPAMSTIVPWTAIPMCMLACLISVSVQAFFASIVYRTIESRFRRIVWLCVCIVLGLGVFANGVASSVVFKQILDRPLTMQIAGFTPEQRGFFTAWLLAGAFYDALLSSILIFKFVRSIRDDGFPETNSILTSLIVSTLETFALTAFTSVGSAITVFLTSTSDVDALMRSSSAAYTLVLLMSRCYAVSFVYTLHRRAFARKGLALGRRGSTQKRGKTAFILQGMSLVPTPVREVKVVTETHRYLEHGEYSVQKVVRTLDSEQGSIGPMTTEVAFDSAV